jgi:hypothetical protein
MVEGLLDAIRARATARPRFGYRRIHVLLRRGGWRVNHKRLYRMYGAEGLAARRRMAIGLRTGCPHRAGRAVTRGTPVRAPGLCRCLP